MLNYHIFIWEFVLAIKNLHVLVEIWPIDVCVCLCIVVYVLTIWVTWHVSYKKQELWACAHGFTPGFDGVRVAHLFNFLSCVMSFFFVLCLVCPMLLVSLDCLFLIAPSVFSDVHLKIPIFDTLKWKNLRSNHKFENWKRRPFPVTGLNIHLYRKWPRVSRQQTAIWNNVLKVKKRSCVIFRERSWDTTHTVSFIQGVVVIVW
jgi:hypothetical protein